MCSKRFYKDDIDVIEKKRVSDGAGGFTTREIPVASHKVFIDTPTADEKFYARQLEDTFERFMYYPYGLNIKSNMRIRYVEEGVPSTYEVAGKPENQGNQNKVMRAKLKLVTN